MGFNLSSHREFFIRFLKEHSLDLQHSSLEYKIQAFDLFLAKETKKREVEKQRNVQELAQKILDSSGWKRLYFEMEAERNDIDHLVNDIVNRTLKRKNDHETITSLEKKPKADSGIQNDAESVKIVHDDDDDEDGEDDGEDKGACVPQNDEVAIVASSSSV